MGGAVSLRGRWFLRALYPLDKNKKLFFSLYDEFFLNLNNHTNGPQSGVDQNRLFAGIYRKINENVGAELGYQLQYVNNPAPQIDRFNHIILSNIYIELPQIFRD